MTDTPRPNVVPVEDIAAAMADPLVGTVVARMLHARGIAIGGDDDRLERVIAWVERQHGTPWPEGLSEEFKKGYDAAVDEIDGIVG